MRLNDEKRSKIKVGDIIEFVNTTTFEILKVKVDKIYKYDNFEQALVIPNGAEADFLRRLKTDNPYTEAEMVESASEITSWANQKMYWAKNNLSLMPDYHVNEFFNELIYSTFLNHCEKR